ncbi:RDD family protein [Mucilaginibacter sp.]|uniref:RDD family protein n=1 Tax=Mucilaginibacter sp. TaxID=1882438 RepID=UPI002ED3EEBD
MLKKQLSATSVVIICFVVPILGFLSEIYNVGYNYFIASISSLISSLNLSWLTLRYSGISNINVFNWIFYFLLLLGAILLVTSKGRETRLPRLGFALIMFHKALFLLYAISGLFTGAWMLRYDKSILFYLLYMLARMAWIWLSWNMLAHFNKKKEPEIQEYRYGEQVETSYVFASKGQRLMNLLLDGIIGILLFSLLIESVIYSDLHNNILMKLQGIVGEKLALVIVIAVCRLLYYVPFELFMGATPAKYLTETYVISGDGNKPDFWTILKRTLSRFIPFESLSFLLMPSGWHDRISDTVVIKEKRTGVNGANYFLIIPAGLLLWAGGYWGSQEYNAYKYRKGNEAEKQRVKDDMLNKLENINTQDFFELRSLGSYYYGDPEALLKVEKVSGNDVTFSVIPLPEGKKNTPPEIERIYEMFKDKDIYKKVSFSKRALRDAVCPPHDEGFDASKALSVNDRPYSIGSIDRYYQANIKLSDRGGWGDHYINIGLKSVGWPVDVTNITAEEGDIKFSTMPPIHLSGRGYDSFGSLFEITGKIDGGNDFKINLTVRDTLGREQVYQVSGNCKETQRILTRLK